jgi:predicted regulator of Ras-like GTPase activity (Roadblock/LC7/MglB family)
MKEILEALNQTSGVQGCLIVGRDGLVIDNSGDVSNVPMDLLGATSTELFSTAESLVGERLEQGEVDLVHVESAKGKFVMMGINEQSFLVVMTRSKVNLGLVRWEVRSAAERLKEAMA